MGRALDKRVVAALTASPDLSARDLAERLAVPYRDVRACLRRVWRAGIQPIGRAAEAPTTHTLKCLPEPFAGVRDGTKPYEIRRNDRNYAVGDLLVLREWSPEGGYTGHVVDGLQVSYMTPGGAFGLPDDLCVLGLRRTRSRWAPS